MSNSSSPREPKSSHRDAAIKDTLRQTTLFARLNEASLDAVVDACLTKRLDKGETLFREGSPALGFYVVQSGSVSLNRISPDGREQVIKVIGPNECFAEATLTSLETYPANAVAIAPSQVILVRKHDFRALVKEQPDLALAMLGSMSLHLKHLLQMIEDLKFKQIENRLANWLVHQAQEMPEQEHPIVELSVSKRILASQLSVTSETLSRAFARFRNENLITVEGKRITILDLKAIKRYQEA